MSAITFSASHGLQTGDCISIPVRLSRWARMWRVIRYMRHNMPPPRRSFCVTAVSSSTSFEIAPTAAEDAA